MNTELPFSTKFKFSAAISLIAVLAGFFLDKPYLWFPIAVFVSVIVSLVVSNKVTCDDLGRAQTTSMFLNILLSITMFVATFGWIVCVALMVWWTA